jgi:hypothetical protein
MTVYPRNSLYNWKYYNLNKIWWQFIRGASCITESNIIWIKFDDSLSAELPV